MGLWLPLLALLLVLFDTSSGWGAEINRVESASPSVAPPETAGIQIRPETLKSIVRPQSDTNSNPGAGSKDDATSKPDGQSKPQTDSNQLNTPFGINDKPLTTPSGDAPSSKEEIPARLVKPGRTKQKKQSGGFSSRDADDPVKREDGKRKGQPERDVGADQAPPQEHPRIPRTHGSLLSRPSIGLPPAGVQRQRRLVSDDEEMIEPEEVLVSTTSMEAARAAEQQATALGYRVRSRRGLAELGFVITVFRVAEGKTAQAAVTELRDALPDAMVDVNHRYELLEGGNKAKLYAVNMIGWTPDTSRCGRNRRIGLIDTPIDLDHPALRFARVQSTSIPPAGTALASSDHGTAVAALLVGNAANDGFRGLLPDAALVAVSVFRKRSNDETDTTAEWLIQALEYLLQQQVEAINMSLGGHANAILHLAIRSIFARRMIMVAAAGNAGPSAPPAFPAAYEEVVAVTAVDADSRPYPYANRGDYVEFAAPGVDLWTAGPDGGGRYRSGTSFASPFVTAALVALRRLRTGQSIEALRGQLVRVARDLGAPGRDEVYGWGLVQAPFNCALIAGD